MTSTQRSVLVVDAHAVIASSLAIALRHSGIERAASLHPDALDLSATAGGAPLARGDIVLLGLLLGDGRTALPLIAPLVDLGCRVVVLTVAQGLPLVGDCLRLGAEAVLAEEMSFERLVGSLRRMLAGGALMTEEERDGLLEAVEEHRVAADALARPFATLTEREAEVLVALVDGRSPKQIAHHEGISVSTVRGHIQRVLGKLQVSSQREALAMARHAGWPPAPAPAPPVQSTLTAQLCP